MKQNLHTSLTATALEKTSARQSGLDVLKCIATFLVVCIHCAPVSYGGTSGADIATLGLNALQRTAVPVFFMITGFYYPDMLQRGKVCRQIFKILQLTIGASLLYFLFGLVSHWRAADTADWLAHTFSPYHIKLWIFLNDAPFGFHLWYLWAILYVLTGMYVLDRLGWWKRTAKIVGGGNFVHFHFSRHVLRTVSQYT